MAKRGNREGSLYLTSEGRYRGAVTMPDGKRRVVSSKTRADAAARLKKLQRSADEGIPVGDAKLTVAMFLKDWLANVLPGRATVQSVNTADQYEAIVRLHLVPTLGRHKLTALTPEHVDQLLRDKARAGLSRSTVTRIRAVLVTALTHAERRDLVYRNAARLSVMPKVDAPAEGRALTVKQAKKLLEVAKGDRLEALYVSGLMLGLRPGELLGLRWPDLDLDAAALQVRSSIKRERNKLRLGEPKTRRSRRALDLPAPVVDALRRHKARQARERLLVGARWVDQDLVFANDHGGLIDPSNLRRSFATLTEAAGLGHWSPVELRHSAVSLLSAAGVPLEHVADVTGHDSTRMTARVYRHAVAPTVSAGVVPMEQMFGA